MSRIMGNNTEEKKGKKKYILLLLLLLFIVLQIVSLIASFYSDIFTKTGTVKTGTLTISGDYDFYLNGELTQLEDIINLNPGDVIVVLGTVTNTGNKSAWVRDRIAFDFADELFLPYLEVYEGEYTQADLLGEDPPAPLPMPTDKAFVTGNRVIDGSGDGAETESGTDYDYIGDYEYEVALTIYFLPTAGNETQGKTFGLTVYVQALQFRNNNVVEPNEIAWSTVTSATGE